VLLVWRRLQLSYQLTCRLTCQHGHSEGTDDGWRSLLEAPGAPSSSGWGALLARLDGAVAVLLGRGCRLKSLEACSAAQMGLVLSALLAGGLCLTNVKPSWEARNAQVTSIEHAVQRAKSRARRANKRKARFDAAFGRNLEHPTSSVAREILRKEELERAVEDGEEAQRRQAALKTAERKKASRLAAQKAALASAKAVALLRRMDQADRARNQKGTGVASEPHFRHECPVHRFDPVAKVQAHSKRCSLCLCWLCGVRAGSCALWTTGDAGGHCRAHPGEPYWRQVRDRSLRERARTPP